MRACGDGIAPSTSGAWAALVGLAAAGFPGACPACWPGYVGIASSLGVGAISPFLVPIKGFALLIVLGVTPLAWSLVRRREWVGLVALITGGALLLEARWLGGAPGLHLLGVVILVATAITTNRRLACVRPSLIQIGRRSSSS
jgi:hypothetical protein